LIFNFNKLGKKKGIYRVKAIVNTLLEEKLSDDFFEIRNSKKKDKNVRWLVPEKKMFIGILKIK
jgi:hypothetical protein